MIVMMVLIRDAVGSPVQGLGLGLLSEMENWRETRAGATTDTCAPHVWGSTEEA